VTLLREVTEQMEPLGFFVILVRLFGASVEIVERWPRVSEAGLLIPILQFRVSFGVVMIVSLIVVLKLRCRRGRRGRGEYFLRSDWCETRPDLRRRRV
jgi:hypothetical protein